jgi:hypothetical protein
MLIKRGLVVIMVAWGLWAAPCPASAEVRLPPDQACKLLRGLDLKTGPYLPQGGMYVCEAVRNLTSGKRPNIIRYQVVGAKDAVQELRLELSVDQPRRQGEAKGLMAAAALRLAQKLGAAEPPDGLEEAVRRASEGSWVTGGAELVLIRHSLPDPPGCYKLVFTAR